MRPSPLPGLCIGTAGIERTLLPPASARMRQLGADAVVSFSIHKLLKPRRADAPALARETRLAQTLVDRGIAAEASGNQTKALHYYRQALEADDSYAPAHMNLGIALQAAGE